MSVIFWLLFVILAILVGATFFLTPLVTVPLIILVLLLMGLVLILPTLLFIVKYVLIFAAVVFLIKLVHRLFFAKKSR